MPSYKGLTKISLIITVVLAGGWFFSSAAAAPEDPNEYYSLHLDKATIAKGYTVEGFGRLKLSLVPGILSSSTRVEIVRLNEALPEPWKLDRVSDFFQFEFKNKRAYDDHKPFYIQFHYGQEDGNYKQVYFYDKNTLSWRPLPTRDFPEEKFVRSLIHLPYARIAVFSNPEVMAAGRASWYAYKPGNYAASPDFPKGSRLRVHLKNSDKFVDVEINDYGPDRYLHPDRVIDLEKNAFAALAGLGTGMLDVYVEPLHIVPENGRVLDVDPAAGIGASPGITASSAVIMSADGDLLWGKKATATRPLASLSKMVALKVFLDTKPTLSREVVYLYQDEEYNYEHVNKWESARLRLEEGDRLTIEDLVYAALVGSANNTVETLVRASGLGRDAFIAKMNQSAKAWGASTTVFIEPTGLAPQNVSSALDYAIITREVLKHPIIAKASTMGEYKLELLNRDKTFNIRNTNHIIRQNKFNITGSKTGYLHESGYCLMMRVQEGGGDIIVVTLGAETRDTSFYETSQLAMYGLRLLKAK